VTYGQQSWPGTYRVTSCASSDGSTCDNEQDGEILSVLQPGTSASMTMPTMTQPTCSANGGFCLTLEIQDPSYPSVAIMARNGVLMQGVSTTTTGSGTENYVITGLRPGSYNVTRNGVLIASGTVTAGDTTLQFTSTSGTIAVTSTRARTGFLVVSPGSLTGPRAEGNSN
jgi:hypothetical protein